MPRKQRMSRSAKRAKRASKSKKAQFVKRASKKRKGNTRNHSGVANLEHGCIYTNEKEFKLKIHKVELLPDGDDFEDNPFRTNNNTVTPQYAYPPATKTITFPTNCIFVYEQLLPTAYLGANSTHFTIYNQNDKGIMHLYQIVKDSLSTVKTHLTKLNTKEEEETEHYLPNWSHSWSARDPTWSDEYPQNDGEYLTWNASAWGI